jgi:hypothetical protein
MRDVADASAESAPSDRLDDAESSARSAEIESEKRAKSDAVMSVEYGEKPSRSTESSHTHERRDASESRSSEVAEEDWRAFARSDARSEVNVETKDDGEKESNSGEGRESGKSGQRSEKAETS